MKALTCVKIAIPIFSVLLSVITSLAFTSKWFEVEIRGAIILSLAGLNTVLHFAKFCMLQKEAHNLLKVSVLVFLSLSDVEDPSQYIEFLEENEAKRANQLNQMTTAFYVALSTFSDCSFDIIQAVILLYGIEYDNEVDFWLIIGTWLGVGEEVMAFIETAMSQFTDICLDCLEARGCLRIFCFVLYLLILSEQSMGIYIAVHGLADYARLQTLCIGVGLALIIILCACPCFIYSGWKNVGLSLISLLLSSVNSGLFMLPLFTTNLRGWFIISMSGLNIIIKVIQGVYSCKSTQGRKNLLFDIVFTSISDPLFDISYACALLVGITFSSEVYLFLLVTTWLGAFQQFVSVIASASLVACKDCSECGVLPFIVVAWLVTLTVQSLAIYTTLDAVSGYDGSFDEEQVTRLVFGIINWCVIGLIICCCCVCGMVEGLAFCCGSQEEQEVGDASPATQEMGRTNYM